MKKLIILSAVAVIGLSSCETCKQCTYTTTNNTGGYVLSTTTQEVCGTNQDFKELEKPTTSVSGGVSVTVKCNCK